MKVGFEVKAPAVLSLGEKREDRDKGFVEVFEDFLKDVNNDQLEARAVEKELASGKVENLQQAIYTIEKADISLRLLVEIRNKAVESYQEIMRMQV
ncbi:flagellar hook-basal body complex protein FliE [Desulfurobacterium pacificum]|uniref:Flagellar hook-basal body complex protein FliE n=1 Tax=Desulfurobacterium pacificum TaxID=240166 RepID=A0ABY1NN22_9BACT|nr:flagellar hook-basal body complex protein FliE [Desulfurobacterium pacificum]SMP13790.1 flagellar hook-basal body complex protein FliE [Desulfurobacterium pacificum]